MKRILCTLCVLYALLGAGISPSLAAAVPPPHQSFPAVTTTPRAAQRSNPLAVVGILALAACAGFIQMGLVAGAVAYHFPRTLSYDPSNEWEDADYFRSLPNALTVLADQHFATPWPRRCNPWCMNRFQRRLERILEPLLKESAERFVRQHLSAWRWTISHRNTVTQLLRMRQREQASRLLAIADSDERVALLALLNTCPRDQLHSRSQATKQRLRRLERLQTILREHGYSLGPAFDAIDRLFEKPVTNLSEQMPGPGSVYRT